jgi:hypothetical protein
MSLRSAAVLLLCLVSSLFASPEAAEAGKAKSPLWAVMAADGTLVRGNGVGLAFRASTGVYVVYLDRDLSTCAFTASTSGGWAGQVGVEESVAAAGRIVVYTVNSAGALLDQPFHLIATCLK